MLDCSLIFFCSGLRESSLRMSDIGLDLLFSPGILERLCKAEGEVGVRRPSGTGKRGKGWGMPGIMIPGGKKGFEDKRMEAGEPGPLEVSGCLNKPKGGGGKPGGRPCIALLNEVGVLLDGGGGGDDLGDEAGLPPPLEFEGAVSMEAEEAVVVMVVGLETTKLSGGDPGAEGGISSLGTGSLSIAAKLLLISCGDACLFK